MNFSSASQLTNQQTSNRSS